MYKLQDSYTETCLSLAGVEYIKKVDHPNLKLQFVSISYVAYLDRKIFQILLQAGNPKFHEKPSLNHVTGNMSTK